MIPNVVHLCFGFSPDFDSKPFSLARFLTVKSIVEAIRPKSIRFYYKYQPAGFWWERTRPYLDLVEIEPPQEIFGVPLCHPAHQADVVRLEVLRDFGGIYLDIDVLCLRSFEPLRHFECVLGQEGAGGRCGLCNAVILAQPNSAFIAKWLEGFDPNRSYWKGFRSKGRDEFWAEMSVKYPAFLAEMIPEQVRVLDHRAFFWPTWEQDDLDVLFCQDGADFSTSFCVHLWEQFSWDRYLGSLTVEDIMTRDTNFNRLARRYL